MTATNVDIARAGFAAVAAGDLKAFAALLDDEVQWHGGDPEWEGACHNRGQALAFMRGAMARNDGRFPTLVDVVDAGDRVVVTPQHAGEAAPVANVVTFRDGKVISMIHFDDVDDARAAAGL